MIKRIDIDKFGLYREFVWNKPEHCSDKEFSRLNIFYGRNYSGKTTLSRIIRCLEKRELAKHCPDGEFILTLDDGSKITPADLKALTDDMKVRVFNDDFIKDNLGWFYREDGAIEPFAVLGEENIEREKEIEEINAQLGSVEEGNGLYGEHQSQSQALSDALGELERKRDSLDNQLRTKAIEIKNEASVYNIPTYQITKIKQDIANITETSVLHDEENLQLRTFLKEDAQNDITSISEPRFTLKRLVENSNELLQKEVLPTVQITELLSDAALQQWVRKGIEIHRTSRDKCGFCGGGLPSTLWDQFDSHFSKESEALRESIADQISLINSEIGEKKSLLRLSRESFYSDFKDRFDELGARWDAALKEYLDTLGRARQALVERQEDIFKARRPVNPNDTSDELNEVLKEINILIQEHNGRSASLESEKQSARERLRLSVVAKFVDEIKYFDLHKDVEVVKGKSIELGIAKSQSYEKINELIAKKRSLEASAHDETYGAELVNRYLREHFGHDHLQLVAIPESGKTKFKFTRDGNDANYLSNGECSLIAFCYFMARIKDELDENLIIFVDDPISSLDNGHIFFIFSLIDSKIARVKKYKQLFISTHNLDFLKYLARISRPESKKLVSHFLVERVHKMQERRCTIRPMPEYLRDNVTEFNYVFGELYEIYKSVAGDRKRVLETSYNKFYDLPNNMRKFLEYYLFYKFPNNDKLFDKLSELFSTHDATFINRFANEGSHLSYIDRGWKPFDVPEAEKCVSLVLEKVKETDPKQFEALVKSLG